MRRRRAVAVFIIGTIVLVLFAGTMPRLIQESVPSNYTSTSKSDVSQSPQKNQEMASQAIANLDTLEVKGRAPKTGYERSQFGDGWAKVQGCSTRDVILYRDLHDVTLDGECKVASGVLDDPYTGQTILFSKTQSDAVQIDHIVPLSNAWQTGAQNLSSIQRKQLANDPLELLAVDGKANQAKGDGDAATWLPKNKSFRCQYITRQIEVKKKYSLWVTQAEKEAMRGVLSSC